VFWCPTSVWCCSFYLSCCSGSHCFASGADFAVLGLVSGDASFCLFFCWAVVGWPRWSSSIPFVLFPMKDAYFILGRVPGTGTRTVFFGYAPITYLYFYFLFCKRIHGGTPVVRVWYTNPKKCKYIKKIIYSRTRSLIIF
jgi:hypothetical protein